MVPINPNEAPEGYVAKATIEWSSCVGCAFHTTYIYTPCTALDDTCLGVARTDKQDVIFVKKGT